MAFPTSRSQIVTNGTASSGTPSVNLPATIRAGDTLFVFFRSSAGGAIGWPAGWTELLDESTDASANQEAAAWRKADGTEGATISLTSGSGKFAAVAYCIQGAADPTITPPQFSTIATGTATEPNATAVTPTGGAKDYLFLTVYGMEGEQTGVTSYPANYTGAQLFANSGTAGAVTTNCTIGSATRQLNASSDDAGVWDVTGTLDDWSAYTFAFHPAIEIPAPLQTETAAPDNSVQTPHRYARYTMAMLTWVLPALTLLPQPTIESQPVTQQKTLILRKVAARVDQPPNLLCSTLTPAAPAAVPFSQTDWPNPPQTQPRLRNLGWIDFFIVDTNPDIIPIDFPNPRVAQRHVGLLTWTQSPAVPPAAAAALPPGKAELPRPPTPRWTWLNVQQETRSVEDATVPFNQTEWPNPRPIPSLRPSELTWTQKRPFFFPEPGEIPPGRLLDQPNPTGRPFPVGLRTHTQARPSFAVDARNFSPYDWPNPRPRPSLSIDALTHIQERPFFYTEPGTLPPGRSTEWPNPRQKPALPTLQTHLEVRKTFYEDASPLNQRDWPLPAPRPRQLVDLCAWIQERPFFYAEPGDIPPGRLLDWPLPIGKVYPVTLLTLINTRQAFHVDLTPSALYDWPNPLVPARLRELTSWKQERPSHFIEPGTLPPGRLLDQPLPQGKFYPVALRTLVNTRQAFHVDQTPASLTDWPNPLPIKSLRIDQLTQIQERPFFYAEPGTPPPGRSTEWPNPIGKIYPISLRTSINTRQAFHIDEQPRHQKFDWLNPLPIRVASDLCTIAGSSRLVTTLEVQVPFAQRDWPNPQGRPALRELRTHLQGLSSAIAQLFVPPFNQRDWPNPLPVPYAIVLRTSTGFRALHLLDQVPAHLTEWPIPQGKAYPLVLRTWTRELLLAALTELTETGHLPVVVGLGVFPEAAGGLDVFVEAAGGLDVFETPMAGLDVFPTPDGGIDALPDVGSGVDSLPEPSAGLDAFPSADAGLSDVR